MTFTSIRFIHYVSEIYYALTPIDFYIHTINVQERLLGISLKRTQPFLSTTLLPPSPTSRYWNICYTLADTGEMWGLGRISLLGGPEAVVYTVRFPATVSQIISVRPPPRCWLDRGLHIPKLPAVRWTVIMEQTMQNTACIISVLNIFNFSPLMMINNSHFTGF